MEATAEQQKTALKLTWKSDEPVWTEQWPLSHEKLQALEQLLSRFSHVLLCDPIDGSPPGSPIPGILQARTLE